MKRVDRTRRAVARTCLRNVATARDRSAAHSARRRETVGGTAQRRPVASLRFVAQAVCWTTGDGRVDHGAAHAIRSAACGDAAHTTIRSGTTAAGVVAANTVDTKAARALDRAFAGLTEI